MNGCKLGLHKWVYIRERKSRWCKKCQRKQETDTVGKWIESRPASRPVDQTKYCECPRDYTVAIKSRMCQRCGLPRRPTVMPARLAN